MSDTVQTLLSQIARLAETRNLDDVSTRLASLQREINCNRSVTAAKGDQIEIESWPDFLNWWNNNRGQNLTYIFMDTYGGDSEQVTMVKKLVRDAEKHEKDLHEFYLRLRDLASQQTQQAPVDDGQESNPTEGPGPVDVDGAPGLGEDMTEDDSLDEIALDL
tara:strand:+ start:223316 stop:223801 length:486 start_codon:yes stop_codon:yes gene_type:complete